MLEKPDFTRCEMAANAILKRVTVRPEVAIILGSSLGGIADLMENRVEIAYGDIPGFLLSTNPSHAGKLVFGQFGNRPAVIMSGRFHFYEGYSYTELAVPVRVLSLLGVKTLIVTNAAGGVNLNYRVGDIMVISDHIKLEGASPMTGPNMEEFGSRFFDVSTLYTPRLRRLAFETASAMTPPLQLQEGVYYYCPGPQFETPAEIRAIRTLGGDAVGMSTVTETLTAGHAGMDVLGFSLITNMAAGVLNQPLSDEEVGVVARASADKLGALIEGVLLRM